MLRRNTWKAPRTSVVAWEDYIHQKGRKQGPRIGTEPPKDFLCLPNVLALPSCEQRYEECFQGTSRGPESRTEALGVDRIPRALASILSPCSRPQPGTLCAEPLPISPHVNLVLPKGHRSCSVCMDQTCLGMMWSEAMEWCMYPSLLDGRCPVCPLLGRQTLGTALLDSRLSGHCPFLGLGQDIFRGPSSLGIVCTWEEMHLGGMPVLLERNGGGCRKNRSCVQPHTFIHTGLHPGL